MSAIIDRLARELGGRDRIDALVDLEPRDLTSLLMHVFAARSERLAPRDLLEQFERTPAFAVSYADPRRSAEVTGALFDAADGFEALELSPVCPTGTAPRLSGVHQNNVLAASRNAEILGDLTLPMALETARRRRAGAREPVIRLCATHRMMRFQPAPPGLLPHFRLFGMTSAGRGEDWVAEELRRHLAVYLSAFRTIATRGFLLGDVTVDVSDTRAAARRLAAAGVDLDEVRRRVRTTVGNGDQQLAGFGLSPARGPLDELAGVDPRFTRFARAVVDPLAAGFPEARIRVDLTRLEGLGYYRGGCVRIGATDPSGATFPLVDGGIVGWTAALLDDARERLLITGIGVDLILKRYTRP